MRDLSAAITDLGGPATLISYVWLLVFHLGAAMLSYHKYGSPMWALLAFVFAVFYYPYYALVLDAPVAAPAPLIGGMFGSLVKAVGGKSTRRR
jgi:membrane protein YdbS with pleckstrin-like domain